MPKLRFIPVPQGMSARYGAITFNATCRSKLSIVPKYDDANRNVIAWLGRLSITGFVSEGDYRTNSDPTTSDDDGQGTSVDCNRLMAELCKDGQRLTHFGYGACNVDVGPGAPPSNDTFYGGADLAWGPKPKLLEFEVLGGGQAARFSWQCEWEMAKCFGAIGPVYSWIYEIDFEIDRGLTVVTMRGSITIPMQRIAAGDRSVVTNIDDFTPQIDIPSKEGFRRKWSRNISKDRRTMNYTIVDTEIGGDNPFPAGVEDIDIKHSISSFNPKPGMLIQWLWRISGSVTVAQDQEALLGLVTALNVLKGRLKYMAQEYNADFQQFTMTNKDKDNPIFALPSRLSVTESLYNKKTTEVDFTLMVTLGKGDLFIPVEFLSKSGLYQKTGDTWADWTESMNAVFYPKGLKRLRILTEFDRLVDVCDHVADFEVGAITDEVPEDQGNQIEILTEEESKGIPVFYKSWITSRSADGKVFHVPYDPDCNLQVQNISPPINEYWYEGIAVVVGESYKVPKLSLIQGDNVEQSGEAITTSYDAGTLPGTTLELVATEWTVPYRGVLRLEHDDSGFDVTSYPPKPPTIQNPDGQGVA